MGLTPARGGRLALTLVDPSTTLPDGSTNANDRQPGRTPRERGGDAPAIDRPRAPPPQLPPLLQRAEHLAHRHLAHPRRHLVAHLPADGLGGAPRGPRLRRADPHLLPRSAGGRARRPLGSLPRPRRHPDPGHGPVGAARRARPRRRHQRLARPRPQRLPGAHQRLRHARAAVAGGADGRRPRRSPQRHRPQLVHGQRRAAARPRRRGRGHRRGGRGVVLLRRRAQLRRRDHLAPAHAHPAAPARGRDRRACSTR